MISLQVRRAISDLRGIGVMNSGFNVLNGRAAGYSFTRAQKCEGEVVKSADWINGVLERWNYV